ncbi:MAG: DUF2339 domain-containing protein [Pseudomonadota bacterium]
MLELLSFLALALVLTVVVGAICGIVALSKISGLRRDVATLTRQLEIAINQRSGETSFNEAANRASQSTPPTSDASVPRSDLEATYNPPAVKDDTQAEPAPIIHAQPVRERSQPGPSRLAQWSSHLQSHWMTWLGGGCVALAGIFLVRYSMDRGWLGPLARILVALATGAALLGVSEYLRRRHGESLPALAALAGAGSMTLYGALLAAMKLYDLIGPGIAFVLMAIVAIGTMALALLHGPVLAAFGILGAYLVPALVSTGSGEIGIALIYALIVSLSALLLLRHVYRNWLWWGFVIGAMVWWLISLDLPSGDHWRTPFLSVLGFLMAAVPTRDWLLRSDFSSGVTGYKPSAVLKALPNVQRNFVLSFVLLGIAAGVTILANPDTASPWSLGIPFFALTLWLARTRDDLFVLPWLTLAACLAAWLLAHTESSDGVLALNTVSETAAGPFVAYLAVFAALAAVGGVMLFARGRRAAIWASLATIGPMLVIGLAYVLNAGPATNGFWGLVTAVFALVYLTLAVSALRKQSVESLVVWLFIGGHLGLGLAAAITFEAASLTVAIAAQLVSLAWVIRTFKLPELGWLLKLVAAIVIVRLTFNPWLADYPTDVHWSLWTYGGSALLAAVATRMLMGYPSLSRWCEGATLHLFVLAVWAEVRYQLYGGSVYAQDFDVLEAVIVMGLSAVLAIVYYRRSLLSQSLVWLYRVYAYVLLGASLAMYGVIILATVVSDSWLYAFVSERPIWNFALAAFALPIVLALAVRRWFDPRVGKYALPFAGAALFAFVSIEIRHLWSGTVRLDWPATSSGELYTYSAVWLVLAITGMLAGSWRYGRHVYRAGIGLLALVIAKLFLVDLSGLDGLLRVASFMGLGLSLLGVAYLHQRLGVRSASEA